MPEPTPLTDAERQPERIAKLGPVELWGRRRETPNEFTRFADAVRNLRAELAKAARTDLARIKRWFTRRPTPQGEEA